MPHTSPELAVPPPLARGTAAHGADEPQLVRAIASSTSSSAKAVAPALRLSGITLSFGGIQALSGIDLTVAQGEIRAIIGPNGAGKSSLVNVISGLYRPDGGGISLDGRAFAKVSPAQLAGLGVARTFQNLALFKGLSVRDNIALGRVQYTRSTFVEQLIGLGRARRELVDARERAAQVIDFVGLADVQDRLEIGRAHV